MLGLLVPGVGMGAGGSATTVNGPLCFRAATVVHPGAKAATIQHPGAKEAAIYHPGGKAAKVT